MNVLNLNQCMINKPCFTIYEKIFNQEKCDEICELQINKKIVREDKHNPIRNNFKGLQDFYSYDKCILDGAEDLEEQIIPYIFDCNSKVYGYDIWGIEEDFHLLTFKEGDHIDYHERILWYSSEPNDRKLSAFLFLSNPSSYAGGNIVPDESLSLSPPGNGYNMRGNLLIFPSFVTLKLSKITRGYMQLLTFDIIGPKLR